MEGDLARGMMGVVVSAGLWSGWWTDRLQVAWLLRVNAVRAQVARREPEEGERLRLGVARLPARRGKTKLGKRAWFEVQA